MISRTLTVLLAVFSIPTDVAGVFQGVATIHETNAAGTTIRGTLHFEAKKGADGKFFMQVSGTLTGLPDGVHGFHIHQFGDESIDPVTGKNRYGSHFVPLCQGLPDPNCDALSGPCAPKEDECKLLEVHGLPPDKIRQAGDMGNIVVQGGQVSLPGALKEVQSGFKQDKMSLSDEASSILGRAVAIHKYEDIGREIPLYDGLCARTCKVDLAATDISPPGRSCVATNGQAKLEDIAIRNGNKYTAAMFAGLDTTTQNVVVRYPTLNANVWYRIKKIVAKPQQPTGLFTVQFDNQNACARRVSGNYLKQGGQDPLQISDPFGAAGPAIAGAIVGRKNPNGADGLTSTGVTDETKPAKAITQISCFLRPTTDAGAKTIGGEVLIVQEIGTKGVRLQYKLTHGTSMGGQDYSFHFHEYGDLRDLSIDATKKRVGKIYKEGEPDDILTLKTLSIVQGATKTANQETYTLPAGVQGVAEYVGRSLTIHSGPTKANPTVSYGVCGIANPDSLQKFDTTTPVVMNPKIPSASVAVPIGLSAASLLVSLFW